MRGTRNGSGGPCDLSGPTSTRKFGSREALSLGGRYRRLRAAADLRQPFLGEVLGERHDRAGIRVDRVRADVLRPKVADERLGLVGQVPAVTRAGMVGIVAAIRGG